MQGQSLDLRSCSRCWIRIRRCSTRSSRLSKSWPCSVTTSTRPRYVNHVVLLVHSPARPRSTRRLPSTESYAGDIRSRNLYQKLAQETCNEKFDASSLKLLAPKQLCGQSRCTVRVTCRTVSSWNRAAVLNCVQETLSLIHI